MRYLLAVVLSLSLVSAINAGTWELRMEDRGLWGTELRACTSRGTPRQQCARITPLIMDDNSISREDLHHLPEGKRIVIRDEYLEPGYEVSSETVSEALAIFSEPTIPEAAHENLSVQNGVYLYLREVKSLKEKNKSLESELVSLQAENSGLKASANKHSFEIEQSQKASTKVAEDLATAQIHLKKLEDQLQKAKKNGKPPLWITLGQFGAVAVIFSILAILGSFWWHQRFIRENRIFPLEAEARDNVGRVHYFRLEDDNTYTCLTCEKNSPRREQGKRLKFKNLDHHLKETEVHADLDIMDPVEA